MIGNQSITSFQNILLSGSSSLETVVQGYLNRIEESDDDINSFVNVYRDDSLARAKDIDSKLDTKESLGRLFGAVVSVKDNICYKDHETTASSRILQGFKPIYSATAVQRLINEDAVIIGSTNCDEFGMGSSGENTVYGCVSNPLDLNRVAGGSSSGAAASVAADFCNVALGSDTGGSVRLPASYCGVLALKPSYGKVSRYGLMAYASSFDQVGVISKSAADIRKVLEVISGMDDFDSTVSSDSSSNIKLKYRKPRIAILRNKSESEFASKAMDHLSSSLEYLGYKTDNIQLNLLEYVVSTYYIIAMAETSSNLARYDGVHFGKRSNNSKDLKEVYTRSRSEGFGDEVKRRIITGSFILSKGYYDAYYRKAQKVRTLIIKEVDNILGSYDYLASPVSNSIAFNKGEVADPVNMYKSDLYTVLANLCGIPALCLPLYSNEDKLPFGIQLHARQFEDENLLDFGEKLISVFPFPQVLN